MLAYDSKENNLYVYSLPEGRITEVDLGTEKASIYYPGLFFERFSFEDAMQGLLAALEVQKNHHEAYNRQIAEMESQLEKYLQNPQ